MNLKTLPTCECSCETCQNMCRIPCILKPEEAKNLIDKGYGDRLSVVIDCLRGEGEIETLRTAVKESEGYEITGYSIFFEDKSCTFFKNGLCTLHDKKLKPIEGQLARCSKFDSSKLDMVDVHNEIVKLWNTKESRNLIEEWRRKYSKGFYYGD